jgi:nicotinamidase-related amidase
MRSNGEQWRGCALLDVCWTIPTLHHLHQESIMRLHRNKTIALCVDVQERLFPHIHQNADLQQRIVTLVRGLNILDVPIIVTEQYSKGLGPTIPAVAEALGDVVPIEKMTFSCCGEPAVEAHLMSSGRHTIVVFGIETHVCVQQTALDLLAQGNHVVVVADATSSRTDRDRSVALDRMRQAGAIISTVESILFELLERAGTETFKQISALVK